ncbi:hypothetical protein [Candidatus Nitrosocosmicus arcticus]|uniref:Uncharacterized protein n=1 Tax=Candidatus Nitrosocosmicus arcticus TaxID=2035267 RepID=A0A557SS36_9ARCH|nr:hypothetical protein [Candidatus Nitrosocosmicus arcticus]TVP39414.1 membrane protein of unknown function [Candidatus Nitrosocosmicus arcticus]
MQSTRKKISEILGTIAIIILLIYIADVIAVVINDKSGFLPLSSKDRGTLLGGTSIALFIISFITGIGIKSRIITFILIAGGVIIASSVMVSTFVTPHLPSSYNNFKIVTPTLPQFIITIIMGFVILGL